MADLTKLESKLGEVTGLAMAAQVVTQKVIGLSKGEDAALVARLREMKQEASDTQKRCTALAAQFDGKKTAILDEAKTTKAKAAEMMSTYLDEESDALDGFEFLTMAEAGEVGHWTVLDALNKTARNKDVALLVKWALPIQKRHLQGAFDGSRTLAAAENPADPA